MDFYSEDGIEVLFISDIEEDSAHSLFSLLGHRADLKYGIEKAIHYDTGKDFFAHPCSDLHGNGLQFDMIVLLKRWS